MKLLFVGASLLVAVGCTSKTQPTESAAPVAISPELGMSVDSARSHVRPSGETRVLVVWKLHNTSDASFDLQSYESDEFHLLAANDVGYPTNISVGTGGLTQLAPKTSTTMLSAVDLAAGISTAGMKFGPVYADATTQGAPRTFIPITIHDDFTSCDKLAELCESLGDAPPAFCNLIEGVTYPLAYPLTKAADDACKERLAESQSAQAN